MKFVSLLLLLLTSLTTQAQYYAVSSAVDNDTHQRAEALFAKAIHRTGGDGGQASVLPLRQLLQHRFVEQSDTRRELLLQQQRSLSKDLGLRLTAGVAANEMVQEGTQVVMGTRVRAGLEWDLLDGNIGDRAREREQLRNAYRIHTIEAAYQDRELQYPYLYNQVIYAFNVEKIEALNTYLDYLRELLALKQELHHNHDIAYTEVIELQQKIAATELLVETYANFNTAYADAVGREHIFLDATQLPIVRIDLQRMIKDSTYAQQVAEVNDLKKSQLDLSQPHGPQVRVTAYANLNHRTGNANAAANGVFVSGGVRATMPLSFDKPERDATAFLEKQLLDEEIAHLELNRRRELMNLYQEYNYKLKQYLTFLHTSAKLAEDIRVENILTRDQRLAHSPMRGLQLHAERMAVDLELIDIKQLLYLNLLKQYRTSQHPTFTECLTPMTEELRTEHTPGYRYLLFDAQEAEQYGTFFYLQYTLKNRIKTVLLPRGTDTTWVARFEALGCRVYRYDEQVRQGTYQLSNDVLTTSFGELDLQPVAIGQYPTKNAIESMMAQSPKGHYLFEGFGQLIELEKRNLLLKQ